MSSLQHSHLSFTNQPVPSEGPRSVPEAAAFPGLGSTCHRRPRDSTSSVVLTLVSEVTSKAAGATWLVKLRSNT